METRANYTLVGGFVLIFLAAILIFVIWLAKFGTDTNKTIYDIYFMGSVTGLNQGGSVRYRGVPVGAIKTIKIDKQDGDKVLVTVTIDSDIILKSDAAASIEAQGITGNSYVQIHGGSHDAPPLTIMPGAQHPIILPKASVFEEVTDNIPAMIQQISRLAGEMRELFSPENRGYFHETLKNLREITAQLAPKEDGKNDLKDVLQHLRTTLEDLSLASTEINQFFKENRGGFQDFTATGLPAMSKFFNEGRETLITIRRISESIERSPSRFLQNDTKQGVQLP